MQNDNGEYRTEIYKRAESMIPQLDGTHNVSDSSDTDSHDYLDLASTNIIQYRTKGAKPKQIRGRGKPKGKPQGHRQNPRKAQEAEETYAYDNPNNYYHNDNYTAPSQS